jgi:sugar phosphate isomerase/epimerase
MLTRRDFSRLALAALPVAACSTKPAASTVRLGVQSYSFRDRSLDDALQAMAGIGIKTCELWSGHVEPRDLKGEDLRAWRLSTPIRHWEDVRAKFERAGVELHAYNYSFRETFSDEEIARGFEMAQALGVEAITASSNVSTAKRIDPHARNAQIPVGMHNHSRIHENEFATPDDFLAAMEGHSEYIAINLDIGHFAAANFDPVDFLAKNHQRIVTLHIKDRKRDQGANLPFGEGDTPIREVLLWLRDNSSRIPANIEYEYKGEDTVAEVRRCFEYCQAILAG